jgi:PadR family transcriptional regulator AphA
MTQSSENLPKLTPTSFALLGLLARKPQSAYQLNARMQGSLMRVYWPRVESHVYSEPKKLLRHKMVSEEKDKHNGRNRTVYTITAEGSRALQRWLSDDADLDLRMQAEFILKLLLADSGSATDVRNTLEKSLNSSHQDLLEAIAGIKAILASQDYAVDGAPYNGIVINLMADILIARYRWGKFALEAIQGIDDELPTEEKVKIGRRAYAAALEKLEAALQIDK